MSAEQIKTIEQFTNEQIHEITNQPPHPEVWKSGIADEESKNADKLAWEEQNKAFKLEIKMNDLSPEKATKLKSEFREFYHQTQKELDELKSPESQQNSYLIIAKTRKFGK